MSLRKRVVVVGSYNQDHVWRMPRFPAAGETVLGHDFATGAGGKGFNQAVASARQGAPTAFIGACGEDAPGRLARRNADAEGLDGHWQVFDEHATGTAAILVDAQGGNRIVVAPGANARLGGEFVAALDAPFQSAGVLLVQLETNPDALGAALAKATRHGALRILNPAPFDEELDASLLRQCDLLTPNENEFVQLLQHVGAASPDAEQLAGMDEAQLHALCNALPAAVVIITLGANGCFVAHNRPHERLADARNCYRIAAPKVAVRDTTGAGDAFNGALAAARVRWPDAPLATCVTHASRAASLSTERAGAAGAMVDFAAVAARFPA